MEQTETGLVPSGPGWFVLNARDAQWRDRKGRGRSVAFTGVTAEQVEASFPQLGANLLVLEPGEPNAVYHWEQDQEAYLVLSGEALLLVEGQERPLRTWDFVHLPPGTRQVILGAGESSCVVLALGARDHIDESCNGGSYVADELARSHGASPAVDTHDPALAYERFEEPEPIRYPGGLLS